MNLSTSLYILLIFSFVASCNSTYDEMDHSINESSSNESVVDDGQILYLNVGYPLPGSEIIGTWKFVKKLSHPAHDTSRIKLHSLPCYRNKFRVFTNDSIIDLEYPFYLRKTQTYNTINDSVQYPDHPGYHSSVESQDRFLFNGDTLIIINYFTINIIRTVDYQYYVRSSSDSLLVNQLKNDIVNWDLISNKYKLESRVVQGMQGEYGECYRKGGYSEDSITVNVPTYLDLSKVNADNYDIQNDTLYYTENSNQYSAEFHDTDGEMVVFRFFEGRHYNHVMYKIVNE